MCDSCVFTCVGGKWAFTCTVGTFVCDKGVFTCASMVQVCLSMNVCLPAEMRHVCLPVEVYLPAEAVDDAFPEYVQQFTPSVCVALE